MNYALIGNAANSGAMAQPNFKYRQQNKHSNCSQLHYNQTIFVSDCCGAMVSSQDTFGGLMGLKITGIFGEPRSNLRSMSFDRIVAVHTKKRSGLYRGHEKVKFYWMS